MKKGIRRFTDLVLWRRMAAGSTVWTESAAGSGDKLNSGLFLRPQPGRRGAAGAVYYSAHRKISIKLNWIQP
ncbi:hypothetical protein [Chitinophaga rhizosphaerae]|uniref:hypothetical protein n=1 Tax=Chitinophaga rhizosphaerae TaxID=1864947 RepID=UPI000F8111D7|nr:hypothetical protein [Chitinophaga rhizosphaerae]